MRRQSVHPVQRAAVALIIVAIIAGCATQPSDGSDGSALFANLPSVAVPSVVMQYGIGMSLPAETRVFDAFAGEPLSAVVPLGIVHRFESADGALSGVLQIVPVPTAVRDGEEPFLRHYFDTYDNLDGSAEYRTSPGSVSETREFARGVPAGVGDEPQELLAVFDRFPAEVSDTHGVLLEIWYPPDRVAEAVAIGESLELPEQPQHLLRSRRFRTGAATIAFEDATGTWAWMADTHDGFVVRRREAGHDLYVAIDRWDAVSVDAPEPLATETDVAGGESRSDPLPVTIARGRWWWEIPLVPRFERDRRRWTGRVPDPDDGGDLRVDVVEPGRAWSDGRLGVIATPPEEEIRSAVQVLFDRAITIDESRSP